MSLATDLRFQQRATASIDGPKVQPRRAASLGPGPALVASVTPVRPGSHASQPSHLNKEAIARNLTVLNQASNGMTKLLERNRELEEHVQELNGWMKTKLQELEQALDAVRLRAETAEENLRQGKKALALLQEGIELAFGSGSAAYAAMAPLET